MLKPGPEKVIRTLADQLAIEASQLKVTAERVLEIVRQTLKIMEVPIEDERRERQRK